MNEEVALSFAKIRKIIGTDFGTECQRRLLGQSKGYLGLSK